jgi:hypothetical protein
VTRPAEAGGVAAAVAFLVARLLGVKDAATVTALGTLVGFVPAAVTWVVVQVRGKNGSTPSVPGAAKP